MIGIGTARDRTIHAGALLTIDARNHADPACIDGSAYTAATTGAHACLDEENATYNILTPNVPSAATRRRSAGTASRASCRTAASSSRGPSGPVNDMNEQSLTPPDFGIYVYDSTTGQNQLVYNDRATWDLNAIAITPRADADLSSAPRRRRKTRRCRSRIGSINVAETDLQEVVTGAQFDNTPIGTGPGARARSAVRVIEGFSSEAAKGVTMFGLTMFEGAAVLGEAPGLLGREAGSPTCRRTCRCTSSRSTSTASRSATSSSGSRACRTPSGAASAATSRAPRRACPETARRRWPTDQVADFTEPIADRTEYPWDKKVQPVLDAKCVSCHNSSTTSYYTMTRTDPVSGVPTTYKIPTLDLSSTPVTVYYDRNVATWPASYVSIFYPATLMMAGDGDTTGTVTISGTVPPMWGVPGSARASVLTQKLNLQAADGTWAWPTSSNAPHPEDQGSQYALTSDERKTLGVYPMDLGGQYWSRQNTGFVPFTTGDPVTPNQPANP